MKRKKKKIRNDILEIRNLIIILYLYIIWFSKFYFKKMENLRKFGIIFYVYNAKNLKQKYFAKKKFYSQEIYIFSLAHGIIFKKK